jgi:hypothetical protein
MPPPRERDRTPAILNKTDLELKLGKPLGDLKPLLGINAGPAPSGEPENADLTEQYRWAGVREVRTQDYYGPLDMSVMYPDLNADPQSASSYDFAGSDKIFAAILDAGLEPYLRLGDSHSNVRIPVTSQQFKNYIQAAVKVVQHYRQGTMNGFSVPFRYVEIGNEPDNKHFWPGRFEDFFPVFVGVYKELEQKIPDLMIGGPGFVVASYKAPAARGNADRFLGYLRSQSIRPSFISFHLYSNDPAEYYDMVQFYRAKAKGYGMENVELHVSEWNTEQPGLEMRIGGSAAPYVTACWIALHQANADASCLFRGTDTNQDNPGFYGIFHADGTRKPAARAFHLWSRMARFSDRVSVQTGSDLLDSPPSVRGELKPVWILAARDSQGNAGILLSNLGRQVITFALRGAAGEAETTELASPAGDLIPGRLKPDDPLVLKPLSVVFLRFKQQEQ